MKAWASVKIGGQQSKGNIVRGGRGDGGMRRGGIREIERERRHTEENEGINNILER